MNIVVKMIGPISASYIIASPPHFYINVGRTTYAIEFDPLYNNNRGHVRRFIRDLEVGVHSRLPYKNQEWIVSPIMVQLGNLTLIREEVILRPLVNFLEAIIVAAGPDPDPFLSKISELNSEVFPIVAWNLGNFYAAIGPYHIIKIPQGTDITVDMAVVDGKEVVTYTIDTHHQLRHVYNSGDVCHLIGILKNGIWWGFDTIEKIHAERFIEDLKLIK